MFLFPHPHVPEELLQRLLAIFPSLVICRPYHFQPPDYIPEDLHPGSIRILHPPSDMKPPDRFPQTLLEYHHWMTDHRDKSIKTFLRSSQQREDTDPSTWELRQLLRQGFEKDQDSRLRQAWRWHVILHLWHDLEVQSHDTAKQLKVLRHCGPLLQHAVEDPEELDDSLRDLSQMESEPFVEEVHYQLVFEAWFGLFGGFLKGEEVFVTLSRGFMDHILQWWKDLCGSDLSIQQIPIPASGMDTQPDLRKGQLDVRAAGLVDEMKRSVFRLKNKPSEMFSAGRDLWERTAASFQDTSDGGLVLTLCHFPPRPGWVQGQENPHLSYLSNALVVAVEEQEDTPPPIQHRGPGSQGAD